MHFTMIAILFAESTAAAIALRNTNDASGNCLHLVRCLLLSAARFAAAK
jgi:hypothetical protein